MRRYFFLALLAPFLMDMSASAVGVMELSVDQLQYNYGTLWIGIYGSEEAFLDRDQADLREIKAHQVKNNKIYLNNLSYGDYAVAIFHDLNDNGEMDFNWMGVPKEPFAFSKPVASKWRVPKFSEVKVGLYQSYKRIHTPLKTWWDQ